MINQCAFLQFPLLRLLSCSDARPAHPAPTPFQTVADNLTVLPLPSEMSVCIQKCCAINVHTFYTITKQTHPGSPQAGREGSSPLPPRLKCMTHVQWESKLLIGSQWWMWCLNWVLHWELLRDFWKYGSSLHSHFKIRYLQSVEIPVLSAFKSTMPPSCFCFYVAFSF